MNFLAHFYLDRTRPESLFAAGAATPDLLSIYNADLRIKKGHLTRAGAPASLHEAMLRKGIERHFAADGLFHTSSFFTEESSFITRRLEHIFPGGQAPRKYFIAHVLLELLLDKVLITRHPGLVAEYYAHFANLSPFQEMKEATERITRKPLPNYENFLSKFLRHRYLYQYSRYEHIAWVLGRILRRAHVHEPGFLESPAFRSLMEETEARIATQYESVFTHLRTGDPE